MDASSHIVFEWNLENLNENALISFTEIFK